MAQGELAWLFLEPDTGLDHCPRILLSCFRARTSAVIIPTTRLFLPASPRGSPWPSRRRPSWRPRPPRRGQSSPQRPSRGSCDWRLKMCEHGMQSKGTSTQRGWKGDKEIPQICGLTVLSNANLFLGGCENPRWYEYHATSYMYALSNKFYMICQSPKPQNEKPRFLPMLNPSFLIGLSVFQDSYPSPLPRASVSPKRALHTSKKRKIFFKKSMKYHNIYHRSRPVCSSSGQVRPWRRWRGRATRPASA